MRAGKVRYIGCSNFLAYHLARALGRSEVRGFARFDSVQPRYNLLFREFERELFPLCLEEGVGVIPYNPIAGGMLSGKHDRTKPPDEGTRFTLGNAGADVPGPLLARQRVRHRRPADEARRRSRRSRCRRSRSRGCSRTRRSPSPIVGASRPEQLDATLAAVDTQLDADLLDRLNEVTAPYRRGDAPR